MRGGLRTSSTIRVEGPLRGLVGNDRQKDLIEFDAWYLFGVDKVINELEIART
jgi:osmotically-inducible protein OsmY